jgi:hypothetical protein
MHLGKVLIATSAALYLQKGDAAGRETGRLSSRGGSAGHKELFAAAAASLKAGGVAACGEVVNATLREVAHTYTEAYVFDVLSHVCHDGTFFHEFPTKEVCLGLTDKLVAEFNAEQDYVSWCKEFEQATRAAGSNSTNGTNATAVESPAVEPEPEPLMNASTAWALAFKKDAAWAKATGNYTAWALAFKRDAAAAAAAGNRSSEPGTDAWALAFKRDAATAAAVANRSQPASAAAEAAPALKNSTNATLTAAEPVLKLPAKKETAHKSKKTKKSERAKGAPLPESGAGAARVKPAGLGARG